MPTLSSRALISGGLFVGALVGCAQRSGTDRAEPDPGDAGRSTVTSSDLERSPNEAAEKTLAGRIAGVRVMETSDGISVRIRGGSSIMGSNEPLYVIDGIPIQPGPNGSLSGINVRDIESIKVVKDPAETAVYGVRGANGVILITTKGSTVRRRSRPDTPQTDTTGAPTKPPRH